MIKLIKCLIAKYKLHKRIKIALKDYKMLLLTQIWIEEHQKSK